MKTSYIAALLAALTLGFVEGFGRFYPAKKTWERLRRVQGKAAVRAMRERFEAAAARRTPRILALALLVLIGVWIASSSLLDKRWWEVVEDVVPYLIVGIAMLRLPSVMRSVAARMKSYEKESGEDETGPGRRAGTML